MIILKNKKLIEAKFADEQELENLVIENFEHFFGPSSIFISKKKIKTSDGFGTIPDGFAIDLATRVWYVVEAELDQHKIVDHITNQLTKQRLASKREETHKLLTEKLVQMITEDSNTKGKFDDEGIKEIDVRKVLGEIFKKPPIFGIPIDAVSNDLRQWANEWGNVKLWTVQKYIQFDNPKIIAYTLPEEFKPVFDTTDKDSQTKSVIKTYDVSISDLIEKGFLTPGTELTMSYKPRGGKQQTFTASLDKDGYLNVLNENFPNPSNAAVFCIQKTGGIRTTENGWAKWKTKDGIFLAKIRSDYLKKKGKKRTGLQRTAKSHN